ncbi:MAG: protease inhibitor I42 family protein [Clostridia bacterium]|nr:protease inhibitor I42 family protein [Clostridia bacterium]
MNAFKTIVLVVLGCVLLFGAAACAYTKKGNTDATETTGGGKTCTLTFDSFDGGGPSYSVSIGDESVVSCTSERRYANPKHDEMDGSPYDVIFTFKGLKPGSTSVTVVGTSPIMDTETSVYTAVVDEKLRVTMTQAQTVNEVDAIQPVPTLVLAGQAATVYPSIADTDAAAELVERLSREPIEVQMQKDDGGFSGEMPWTLPQDDDEITAQRGDIVLSGIDRIILCTAEQTGAFTRLATLRSEDLDRVLPLIESGETISLWVEWSE